LESLIHFLIVDKALYVADIDLGSKIFFIGFIFILANTINVPICYLVL
ncbi:unnamed protein product, partial [Brassica napus]